MNDRDELIYCVRLLEEFAATNGIEQSSNEVVREFFRDRRPSGEYLGCFSSSGDLLSQWRAYADDGAGFSIGFSLDELSGAAMGFTPGPDRYLGPPMSVDQVVYDRAKQLSLIHECTKPLFYEPEYVDAVALDGVEVHFEQLMCLFKSDAFQEENEWRIVTASTWLTSCFTDDAFRFRATRYGIAPYLEMPFDKTAITQIVVGPRSPMRDKTDTLVALLKCNGFDPDGVQVQGFGRIISVGILAFANQCRRFGPCYAHWL